jgi:hypothetical protein
MWAKPRGYETKECLSLFDFQLELVVIVSILCEWKFWENWFYFYHPPVCVVNLETIIVSFLTQDANSIDSDNQTTHT